jgi:transposase-like protein
MPLDPLTRVRRATARRSRSEAEWREAIRTAVASGRTVRAVGEAAGVSHVRVLQIVRGA